MGCMQELDLLVAALDLRPAVVGEACFPVSSLLTELVVKESELDGKIYASPQIGLDLYKEGAKAGRLYLSFESKTPPFKPAIASFSCCSATRTDEEEMLFAAP